MRFIVRITLPTQLGNELIKSGKFGEKMDKIFDELKPEAVYCTEMDGHRTVLMIAHLTEANHMMKIAEPFFMGFDAKVEFHPAMTPDEVMQGMPYAEFAAKLG